MTSRAGQAAGVRLGGSLVVLFLRMALGVILARLLSPHEFGIYATAFGIVTMTEMLGSSGMHQALVQRKTLTPEDEVAGLGLQMITMLLLGGGLVLAGPMIEKFFQMPGLGLVVQLQSVFLVFTMLRLVPSSRLHRRLAFTKLATVDILTQILGGSTAILLALQGQGVLALVAGSIIAEASRTGLLWAYAPGRILLRFRVQAMKNLLSYGIGVLLIRTCNGLAGRLDVLIIGHRMGAELVGFYQRSFQLVLLPLGQFTNAVTQILFPVMARIQDEDRRFQRGYLGAVGLSGMVAFPSLTLIWTTGDIFIPLLYGPQWGEIVPILNSLAVVGYLRVINTTNGLVTQARGHVMAEAVRQAAFAVLTALFVFLGTHFGMQGVVLGIGLATLLFLALMTHLALSVAEVKFIRWLDALRTTVISSAAMGALILGLKIILAGRISNVSLLIALSFCGFSVYFLAFRVLLTGEQRQILERVLAIFPPRLQRLLGFFIGSTRGRLPSPHGRPLDAATTSD